MSSQNSTKILLGNDIYINDFITIKQPTIEQIVDFDEQKFYSIFYSMCSISSDMKSVLWDMGIDYTKISDWELFLSTCRGFTKDDTNLIFGDIDLSISQIMVDQTNDEKVLVLGAINDDGEFVPDLEKIIRESDYLKFIEPIREMLGYTVKREMAANKVTKLALIDEDRIKRKANAKKQWESPLFQMIVSLVNTEEFKYNYAESKNLTMFQLMTSFKQVQNKKSACALYQGSMSGFVDTSKIDKNNFQWIYTND